MEDTGRFWKLRVSGPGWFVLTGTETASCKPFLSRRNLFFPSRNSCSQDQTRGRNQGEASKLPKGHGAAGSCRLIATMSASWEDKLVGVTGSAHPCPYSDAQNWNLGSEFPSSTAGGASSVGLNISSFLEGTFLKAFRQPQSLILWA